MKLTDAQRAAIARKPIRTCLTMHSCCICDVTIALGQEYHDGGYGRRAHVACVAEEVQS